MDYPANGIARKELEERASSNGIRCLLIRGRIIEGETSRPMIVLNKMPYGEA